MLKIRLMRIGGKKKPFYRVVAVDERSKRTGGYIELLGTYNPLTEPKDVKLKQDRIDYWIKQGAQPSDGYLRIIGKAPQRPPRKPKKASKQGTGDSGQVRIEEPVKKTETAKSSEPEAISVVENTPETVIASEAKQSFNEIATSASGETRDDEKVGAKKDEGAA